jgi:hypothetical protein
MTPLTSTESHKLRTVCLAYIDKVHYACLISHIMREHILMHFPPSRRLVIKPAIAATWKELLADGTLVRGHGWALTYWPAPVAYPQPWSAWVWRAARRPPKAKEAHALARNPETIAAWKALGHPAEGDYWAACRRALVLSK